MSNYITEAFKQLNLLEDMEEVKDISLDASGVDELRSFLADAAVDPDEEMIDVYDLQAEAEEDLQKSYEGKVILECTVCHSNIFEDPENISITEDGKACMDLECPYCMSNEGYYIIGEVAPYNKNAAEEPVEDAELDEVDIEGAADAIDDEDIIEESCDTKKLKEDWDEEFENEYDSIMNDDSLTEADRDKALKKLYAYYGMNESMKLDGVKELYDNDEIRGVDELEGSNKMEGSDEIRGDKHKAPINEDAYDGKGPTVYVNNRAVLRVNKSEDWQGSKYFDDLEYYGPFVPKKEFIVDIKDETGSSMSYEALCKYLLSNEDNIYHLKFKKLDESCDSEKLEEDIEDVSVTTEDETMTMTTKEDGGVVIETSPKSEDEFEAFGDIEVEDTSLEPGDEMVAPISDETSDIIDASSDALDTEDEESFDEIKADMEDEEVEDDMLADDEDDFADLEDFDEESFDGLGESYLRNCYENVKGFRTSKVSTNKNKLFIEGVIKFDSGNEKKTNFVFNPTEIKNNRYKFEGYNKEISRGKKTFKLSGIKKNNKFVCESLNYNYRSKNELNESVRVYGTVKKRK